MPHTQSDTFVAPEQRLTAAMHKRLEQLAPLFYIQLDRRTVEGLELVEFSGEGFSEDAPLELESSEANVRLLAELCSILARWIPFSFWEPCEVTLFALPPERVERCAASFRKQLAKQQRELDRAAAAAEAREAIDAVAADQQAAAAE